jgi:drug/metabolite transporter (DMT)-like permease
MFGEHIGRRATLGIVLVGAAGLLLAGNGGGSGRGAILIVAACLCWALDNNLTATAVTLTPAQLTLAKGVVAGSVNLAIGLARFSQPLPLGTVIAALGVGAIGYGLSIMLWVSSARQLGTARSQAVFATAPFIGMVLGWVFTDDGVRPGQIGALTLMVAGVSLIVTSAHTHVHRHPPMVHTHRHRHDDGHHDHDHDHADPAVRGAHSHEHEHSETVHTHPHLPDEWHRHDHGS